MTKKRLLMENNKNINSKINKSLFYNQQLYFSPNLKIWSTFNKNTPNSTRRAELGSFNDYQYIKSKWLFELFLGGCTIINKNFGYILNKTLIKKKENISQSIAIRNNHKIKYNSKQFNSDWISTIVGESTNLYSSVLKISK